MDLQRFMQGDGEKKREINERKTEREREREREGNGILGCVLFSKLSTASPGADGHY